MTASMTNSLIIVSHESIEPHVVKAIVSIMEY